MDEELRFYASLVTLEILKWRNEDRNRELVIKLDEEEGCARSS